ncbi:exo-beta-1,3-glucanase [Ephemerocybe angulata]|uniref:glucan 1,3-beta-glucosidase n=1 Tax=Ephemerocybe angulata TaxID=980116 RepID=A0A8H6MCH4_9AGAR|nr:exo-beta-1,3-glucanase [Tulosesus angulatus]
MSYNLVPIGDGVHRRYPMEGQSPYPSQTSYNNSSASLNEHGNYGSTPALPLVGGGAPRKSGGMSRRAKILIGVGVFIVIAAGVAVALVFTVGKKKGTSTGAGGANSTSGAGGKAETLISGKTGSTITAEDGKTFTYASEFDGEWVHDPKKPLDSGGKAQSWSPRIGEEWKWGEDVIRGVNLGGWLVTEPFIVPALYEKYYKNDLGVKVEDEWTLCQAMGSKLAEEMENHYKTFITEKDFAEIAGAGLNWIRIPIGYWAIETMNDEPYLEGVSWKYFLKALVWARKYGLRIYLDFHGLPGSQNGWNHSGKGGEINFMNGVMGVANAQRTLTYIRIFTEFVNQPQYKDVVLMFGIVNEIRNVVGTEAIQSFYGAAHEAIRKVTGTGKGNGLYIAMHEGFLGLEKWQGALPGADRVILDQHPYLAFEGNMKATPESSVKRVCDWGSGTSKSSSIFGITIAGEFSTAINGCGLNLNGVGSGEAEGCDFWDNWAAWDQTTIGGLQQVSLASMDALQNWFYWTWKIGESSELKTSSCPMWHYKLGLEKGWIPKDPRGSKGVCDSAAAPYQPFDGQYPASATGGGPGKIVPTPVFPPATLSPGLEAAALPTYTATGTLKIDAGSGWSNPDDNELAYVPVAGCSYPNAYSAVSVAVPPACTGA